VDDGGHNQAHDAWRVWLSRHEGALLLLARQYVASAAEAQDAVQEGFVRFWRARNRAADQTAYLFACVRTAALDLRRSRMARQKREAAVAEGEMLNGPAELEDRWQVVVEALKQLPQEQREVVVMKIWSELTFGEIATALGISANTAASRYRYAMERLQKLLLPEVTRE
jgi:RNA polymerase sigma-70 factor, ECF subfamily